MKISMRAARINKGMTLAQAAEKLGCALLTVWKYEMGKTQPNAEMIERMVRLYGIPYRNINFVAENTDTINA